MKNHLFKRWLIVLFMCFITGSMLLAQEECPSLVVTVIDNLLAKCSSAEPDSLCFVHPSAEITSVSDALNTPLELPGDTFSLENTRNVCSAPLDRETNTWGVNLLTMSAGLPESVAGGIRLLLIGDAELASATGEAFGQGFYLRTGMDDAPCSSMPESGLLIQVPQEAGEIAISINGVDLTVNGSIYVQAQINREMRIRAFTGALSLHSAYGNSGAVAGTAVSIPMDEMLFPAGPPSGPEAYAPELTNVSTALVGEVINPPTEEQALLIEAFTANGLPLCGSGDFLPACEALISRMGGELCPLNAEGAADCSIVFTGWDELGVLPFDEVSRCDSTTEGMMVEPISTLPPGCEPGICLQDPAQACKCVLCGVACPVATATQEPVSPAQPPPQQPQPTNPPPAPTNTPCPLPFGCDNTGPPIQPTPQPVSCGEGQLGPGGICIPAPPGS